MRAAPRNVHGFPRRPVDRVVQSIGIHEHAAPLKGGESRGLLRRQGRHLLGEAVNGPPHQFADRAVLLTGDGAKPHHHRLREQHLKSLYRTSV